MISTIVSRLVILVFGTLYPAYASYKAVRTKNVKEYVKWMMYWIVFALFTCAETFTDVFLSWFPFYYEIKIILVLWLLSPATKGSSILYRKFVHPMLSRREQEIDDYIAKAKEQGYHTVLNLGTKGVNYATTVIMQTAIKGGGGIVNQLRKSYSLSDLTDDTDSRADIRGLQEAEQTDVVDPRHVRRRHSPRRSSSGSSRMDMYFPEVDIRPGPPLSHVRSTEDVSSGYSSAEPLYVGQPPKLEPREGLVRTASVGGASRPRTRTTRASLSTKKSSPLPEDSEGSESDSDITIIQKISKTTQKIKRTIILHEETDSSDENVEFEDTIGFPIENNPIKIEKILGNISETSQTIIEPQMTQNFEAETKIETVIEVQIEKQSSVDDFEESNENIQTEKILDNISKTSQTIIEPQITQNFEAETKIETVIEVQIEKQASVDDFEESNENLPTDDDEITEDTSTGSITTVLEVQIGKGPSINIFEDTNEANIVEEKLDQRINDKNENNDEQIIGIVEECQKNEIVNEELQKSEENAKKIEIVAEESNSNIDLETETISSQRRGKYNKMTAPVPPTNENKEIASKIEEINMENSETVSEISESVCDRKMAEKSHEISLKVEEKSNLTEVPTSESESHPIKATLVLKPGVIKNIGSEESPNSSIFFSQSPKPKHKTKKHENPISRLMMLPKKIFGSKESSTESLKEKRKSLNLDSKSLTPSVEDLKSKSDTEDLYEPIEYFGDKKSVSAANIADKKFEDNKMILRNLSHSPKQYRRKVKKENYDYEDSD